MIDLVWFKGKKVVGVIVGVSVFEELVYQVIVCLCELGGEDVYEIFGCEENICFFMFCVLCV